MIPPLPRIEPLQARPTWRTRLRGLVYHEHLPVSLLLLVAISTLLAVTLTGIYVKRDLTARLELAHQRLDALEQQRCLSR